MTNSIGDAVTALANHIAAEGSITFRDLFEYLESLGIETVGDEDLMGEHVNQPHVSCGTTLRDSVSEDVVQIVTALFQNRPLMLEIGDMADFASGEEPWWLTWTGHRDALIDAAIEFVRDEGAATFMELADHLQARGVAVLGGMSMMLGRRAVGDGTVMARPSNSHNVVLWNCGSSEFLQVIEQLLNRDPRVVLERTTVEHYRRSGMVLLEDYADDGRSEIPLPVIDFGDAIRADGYEVPTWLPVMFAWAGRE